MTGDGWVWVGNDGIAASILHADAGITKAANGMLAVSPKSKSKGCFLFRIDR